MWTASGDRIGRCESGGGDLRHRRRRLRLLIPELSTEAPPDVASCGTCAELARGARVRSSSDRSARMAMVFIFRKTLQICPWDRSCSSMMRGSRIRYRRSAPLEGSPCWQVLSRPSGVRRGGQVIAHISGTPGSGGSKTLAASRASAAAGAPPAARSARHTAWAPGVFPSAAASSPNSPDRGCLLRRTRGLLMA
jgi:hypothetical protein